MSEFYCNICDQYFVTDEKHRVEIFRKPILVCRQHGFKFVSEDMAFVRIEQVVPEQFYGQPLGVVAHYVASPAREVYVILRATWTSSTITKYRPTYKIRDAVAEWISRISEDAEASGLFLIMLASMGGETRMTVFEQTRAEFLNRIAELFDLPKFWDAP